MRLKKRTLAGLARAGYATRGCIYLFIGVFAAIAAWSTARATKGTKGAIASIEDLPAGELLVVLIGVGLVGYSIWRFVQAVFDADSYGTSWQGVAIRVGMGISALIYLLLAVFAFGLVLDGLAVFGGTDTGSSRWAQWLLQLPFGQWLLALAGLIIAGVGIVHGRRAWNASFEEQFIMNPRERRLIIPICRFGLGARAVVFAIVGVLTVTAATGYAPSSTGGTANALQAIQTWPYGWLLLGVMAVGLFAFGIYSISEACYRRISAA